MNPETHGQHADESDAEIDLLLEPWQYPAELTTPLNAEMLAAKVLDSLRPTRLSLNALLVRLEQLCRGAALAAESRSILMGSLLSDRLELLSPIPVHVECDGRQHIASSKDLGVFGVGIDEESALDDLRLEIVEFYYDLKDEPLGEHLRQRYVYLSSVVREKK